MPLPAGTTYRVKTTKTGKQVRLAFNGNKVIEAKNLATGATHTPQEFAADRARSRPAAPSIASRISALRGAGAFTRGKHGTK